MAMKSSIYFLSIMISKYLNALLSLGSIHGFNPSTLTTLKSSRLSRHSCPRLKGQMTQETLIHTLLERKPSSRHLISRPSPKPHSKRSRTLKSETTDSLTCPLYMLELPIQSLNMRKTRDFFFFEPFSGQCLLFCEMVERAPCTICSLSLLLVPSSSLDASLSKKN